MKNILTAFYCLFLLGCEAPTTFYIVNNTDFYHDDYEAVNESQLRRIVNQSYDALFRTHRKDYQSFFHRVSLDLDNNGNIDLPTDERLANMNSLGMKYS